MSVTFEEAEKQTGSSSASLDGDGCSRTSSAFTLAEGGTEEIVGDEVVRCEVDVVGLVVNEGDDVKGDEEDDRDGVADGGTDVGELEGTGDTDELGDIGGRDGEAVEVDEGEEVGETTGVIVGFGVVVAAEEGTVGGGEDWEVHDDGIMAVVVLFATPG